MANTNLTNQRQVFAEEYVRSGDHLEAAFIITVGLFPAFRKLAKQLK